MKPLQYSKRVNRVTRLEPQMHRTNLQNHADPVPRGNTSDLSAIRKTSITPQSNLATDQLLQIFSVARALNLYL
jgi:hypothetical protein